MADRPIPPSCRPSGACPCQPIQLVDLEVPGRVLYLHRPEVHAVTAPRPAAGLSVADQFATSFEERPIRQVMDPLYDRSRR
jgi:hypothetical protein